MTGKSDVTKPANRTGQITWFLFILVCAAIIGYKILVTKKKTCIPPLLEARSLRTGSQYGQALGERLLVGLHGRERETCGAPSSFYKSIKSM